MNFLFLPIAPAQHPSVNGDLPKRKFIWVSDWPRFYRPTIGSLPAPGKTANRLVTFDAKSHIVDSERGRRSCQAALPHGSQQVKPYAC